ncbi:hypothetical protein [Joostella sp. CR20]|uniref:hypothetical protein n=1 Tax=Joostella sp. CR20 TaxID=2804312 RepID=UPI00313BD457
MIKINIKGIISLFFSLFCSLLTFSQSQNVDDITVEEMAKKRQDPVAGLRSVYFQEVLLPVGDGIAQSFSIQPVWPFKLGKNLKLITYTIIPFQSVPGLDQLSHVPIQPTPLQEGGSSSASGLGNILFNGYFSSIEKKGSLSWGVGPAIQLPTRTSPILGSNRVSMGPSFLLSHAGDKLSAGFVVQNYWSLGGEAENKVNSFNFQYFAYYNLPKGWFIESNATVVNNWLADNGDQMLLPLGGGPGKTFKIGKSKLFYCAAAQVFYNVVRPEVVGSWEAVLQFQLIFN